MAIKHLLLLLVLLFSINSYSQDDYEEYEEESTTFLTKPVDDCKIPFTDCWCELRPNNPHCDDEDTPAASIDNYLLLLALVGILIYKLK